MKTALIGHTGFVGSTFARQFKFDSFFRSTDIESIQGGEYSSIVCAGAPGQKWLANKEPERDLASIERLIRSLENVRCESFTLISTVDVFSNPSGVNEDTVVTTEGLHAYGKNRYRLEEFVRGKFKNARIVRLPGLVGPGLRKNVVFDFLNANNLDQIESRSFHQFYPMVNLWADIQSIISNNISLCHLTAEPIEVAKVASQGFGIKHEVRLDRPPVVYDFQTKFGGIWAKNVPYQYSRNECLLAIRAYAQSEPLRANSKTT